MAIEYPYTGDQTLKLSGVKITVISVFSSNVETFLSFLEYADFFSDQA